MAIQPPIDDVLASNPELGTVLEEIQTGLSKSFVFVLAAPAGRSVLKLQIDRGEHDFYVRLAPRKFRGASWLPKVLANGWQGEWNWLQLECVPQPLPRSKWNFDERALRVLKTLHGTAVSPEEFKWTECSWMPTDLAFCQDVLPAHTNDLLFKFQEAFAGIANQDRVLCSGDPYPLNWLERADGELVKIDWQGLAFAHRAFDLAGWIASPLPLADIERIAQMYLGLGNAPPDKDEVDSLTRAVVVFYTRRCGSIFKQAAESPHPDRWQAGADTMARQLPQWLTTVEQVL